MGRKKKRMSEEQKRKIREMVEGKDGIGQKPIDGGSAKAVHRFEKKTKLTPEELVKLQDFSFEKVKEGLAMQSTLAKPEDRMRKAKQYAFDKLKEVIANSLNANDEKVKQEYKRIEKVIGALVTKDIERFETPTPKAEPKAEENEAGGQGKAELSQVKTESEPEQPNYKKYAIIGGVTILVLGIGGYLWSKRGQ